MKFLTALSPALILALLTGCASAPQIVKLPGDTYSITRTDKGGSLGDVGSTKAAMMHDASDFAAKEGKVASTVSMKESPAAVQGFTTVEYRFTLVDKDVLPQTATLTSNADSATPKTNSAPASPLTRAQGPHSIDIYSELLKLDELRKRGILTDEEFAREKKKVLDSN